MMDYRQLLTLAFPAAAHHKEGDQFAGMILRRIVDRGYTGKGDERGLVVTLNCGHTFVAPRGLRMTVGKLTGCPECK